VVIRKENADTRKASIALLSVASNSALVILKLGVGIMIGSVSVISEAIHSGIDFLATAREMRLNFEIHSLFVNFPFYRKMRWFRRIEVFINRIIMKIPKPLYEKGMLCWDPRILI